MSTDSKGSLSVKIHDLDGDTDAQLKRLWTIWRKLHNRSEDPKDSPLYQVLGFAKNTEVGGDPTPLRKLLAEQQKRAAFRLFALKQQQKLCDSLINTPYQRFLWGN